MPNPVKCTCQSCTIRGLMGPAVVITIGVLFLLNQLHQSRLGFGDTWPVILIVIGLIKLASSLAPNDGHIEVSQPSAVPPVPPTQPPTPPPTPTSTYGAQGQ